MPGSATGDIGQTGSNFVGRNLTIVLKLSADKLKSPDISQSDKHESAEPMTSRSGATNTDALAALLDDTRVALHLKARVSHTFEQESSAVVTTCEPSGEKHTETTQHWSQWTMGQQLGTHSS